MIFRNWVLQNFPFLEDDFDALTDYELFCKMIEYMRKAVDQLKVYDAKFVEFNNKLTALENYVYNLDIQDAVDNKLDEMYENGQLQSLIEQFIDLQVVFTYNSVADLKQATNLINGSFVRTSGYTTYNDLGGAIYKVRNVTSEDVIDEKKIIALHDITLVAEIIPENTMNPKQFGALGDGETDDTESIQLCIDTCKNVLIRDGIYMVDAETSINLASNSKIELVNASIKALPNDLTNYAVIMIDNVHDVIISGGNIIGDREEHTGLTGEWGHGIHIKGDAYNITIKDISISKCWGDGIYINQAKNINTQNVYIDNARRNGISVISCDTYHSLNDYIVNTNGTAPESAIDFEPNYATDVLKNIVVDNLVAKNSNGDGIDISLSNLDATSDDISISFNNIDIDTCGKNGVMGGYPTTAKGVINFNDLVIKNAQQSGMYMNARYSTNGVRLNVVNLYVKNFNLANNNHNGFLIGSGDSLWGNVYLKNPYIETDSASAVTARGIVLGGYQADRHPINVILDTPLNKQFPIRMSYGEKIKIIDTLDVMTSNELTDNANVINADNVNVTYTNEGFTSNVTVVPRPYSSTGTDYIFRKIGSGNLTVRLASGEYCHALSDSVRPRITLTKVGESITLRKISATEWIPVNIVGTPTITT